MRLPFIRDRVEIWSAHAAEIGRVGTVVAAVSAIVVVIAEAFRPGVVGAVLPLETTLAALSFCIVLSLLVDSRATGRYAAVTALYALAVSAVAGKTAMTVFSPEGEVASLLVTAAVVVSAVLVAASRHPEK